MCAWKDVVCREWDEVFYSFLSSSSSWLFATAGTVLSAYDPGPEAHQITYLTKYLVTSEATCLPGLYPDLFIKLRVTYLEIKVE